AQLALAAAVAALSAAVGLLLSVGHAEQAHASIGRAAQLSTEAGELRTRVAKLWEDHITWTRMVIVDFAANLPDLKIAESRLLRNQADIGNAIKAHYGAAGGR